MRPLLLGLIASALLALPGSADERSSPDARRTRGAADARGSIRDARRTYDGAVSRGAAGGEALPAVQLRTGQESTEFHSSAGPKSSGSSAIESSSVATPRSKDRTPWKKELQVATGLIAGGSVLLLIGSFVRKMQPHGPMAAKAIGWAVTAMGAAVTALGLKIMKVHGQKTQGAILMALGLLLILAGQMLAWADAEKPDAQAATDKTVSETPGASEGLKDLKPSGADTGSGNLDLLKTEPAPQLQLKMEPAPELQLKMEPSPELQLKGVETPKSNLDLLRGVGD